LFLGRICPYKNVPKLIKEFKAMEEVDARLIIAGRPSSDKVAAEVTQGRAGDHRIRLDLGHISQEKVCQYFQAADLVALPYTDILNSGTALLSLSLDRPVLVPNLGALRELAEEVGTQWVRCYDGHLTAQELSAALRWAQSATRPAHAPVDHLAWPSIGNKTLEAYKTVLADKGA
jgi:glycosyltransferase involved in cell wall biosynthesis